MKNSICIITLCLLLLWPGLVQADATPEWAEGETSVTLTYISDYRIPGDEPYDPDFSIRLIGQTRYTDHQPFSHGFMELHPSAKRAMTDQNGFFTMENLQQGSHVLKALDPTNREVGALRFRIDRTNTVEGVESIPLSDGTIAIHINPRIRQIEVILELDRQGNLSIVQILGHPTSTEKERQKAPIELNPVTGRLSGNAVPVVALLLLAALVCAFWVWQNNKRETR